MEKVFEYNPTGVCSKKMIFIIDNDTIKNIKIIGGCPGNSLGVASLCRNKKVEEVITILGGIKCGNKTTSCPDQISKALEQYKKEN